MSNFGITLQESRAIPTVMTRFTLASALATNDPNTRLSGVASDDGTGISLSVTGGWSSTDPLDGIYITWPLKDVLGTAVDVTKAWDAELLLVERTAPGLSSDTSIVVGIMNETVDSGTVDAHWGGMRYTAAARNVRVGGIVNGSTGSITEDNVGTSRQVWVIGTRVGVSRASSTFAQGMDAAGAIIAADFAQNSSTSGGAGFLNTGTPTVFVAIYRTAATAGTELVKFDLYVRPFIQSSIQT